MKLEINLTDEQAAEIKAALLKIEPEPLPAMPSDPALPEPPGLRLELGKTYATNSREIVTLPGAGHGTLDENGSVPRHPCNGTQWWNGYGQLFIDGVAQPLDHPDSIKEEIPSELLPLPKLPDGFKEWRARGYGWKREKGSPVAYKSLKNPEWNSLDNKADGSKSLYYLEAIPADKPEPEPRKAREWDASTSIGATIIGPIGRYSETIRVREILPGDPTPEQVATLTDALWHALERLKNLQSYQSGTAYVLPSVTAAIEYGEAALAPFRK